MIFLTKKNNKLKKNVIKKKFTTIYPKIYDRLLINLTDTCLVNTQAPEEYRTNHYLYYRSKPFQIKTDQVHTYPCIF